ncbi:MAG: phosphoglycerate kinase, partial [Candidatus Blackburnbacteria bacterium]|nr:phosphoglycerate kinase [Candidatus Blackburnbacteria bacterium]
LDLDVQIDIDKETDKGKVANDHRLRASIPTFKYLIEHGAEKIVVLGHRGRPEGRVVENLSLGPIGEYLEKLLIKELGREKVKNIDVFMMENLRFDPREEKNDLEFAKELAKEGEAYVNEAFGTSHRESASIVGLPKLLPHAAGIRLQEEVENLTKVLEKPKEPVVFVMGGGKMDKVVLVEKLLDRGEWVLVGGVLPKKVKSYCREKDGRMCIAAARLAPNGEDITPDSARNFAEIIKTAGTLVWNGPMGDIDNGFWEGTKIVAEAVAQSSAFKIVGGGDTIRALQSLGLLGKMDYISIGGGAMLEFLAYGDLPGLKALRK